VQPNDAIANALRAVDENDTARTEAARPLAPTFALEDCYGVVGDYVRVWAPHTEAAPVSIYACALAACGSLIGRGPTWHFGNVAHHVRLWPVVIGPSGSGRKSTGITIGVDALLPDLDADFARAKIQSGLSSAEGLIELIRDATPEREVNGKTVPGDAGVSDKRLCVVEKELGGPLQSMARDGNRLSPVLRQLWDGADPQTIVKQNPQRATAPHVVIIGAITAVELRKLLTSNAIGNGLANRFLPVWTTRVQYVPDDTQPDPHSLASVLQRLRGRIADAYRIGAGTWTPTAKIRWRTVYRELSTPDDPSDTVRVLLERGAPYVRRIAFLLALLDGTSSVSVAHLDAAVALWRYTADTWRHVFHDGKVFSPLAAKILAALADAGAEGLTRSQIREDVVCSGDVPAEKIAAALSELSAAGLAHIDKSTGTRGRTAERWRHAKHLGASLPAEGTGEKGGNSEIAPFTPFPTAGGIGEGPGKEPCNWDFGESAA